MLYRMITNSETDQKQAILSVFKAITNRNYITAIDIIRVLNLSVKQFMEYNYTLALNQLEKSGQITSGKIGQTTVFYKT